MITPPSPGSGYRNAASPWIIVGTAAILLGIVIALAVQNYHREEHYMARILTEKGAALIKAVEAGTRTGMARMMWGGDQIQTLIEETALLPGVEHITITDAQGTVVASSLGDRVGSRWEGPPGVEVTPSDAIQWHMVPSGDGRQAFEVYRTFKPMNTRGGGRLHRSMHGRMAGAMERNRQNWFFPGEDSGGETIIRVSLDPRPFEEARSEDVRNTVIISGVLVLLGLAGFISMFWMQNYRAARRSLRDTSAIADEIVTSLPVGLIATDREDRIAFFNASAERITGLDLSGARGRPIQEILPEDTGLGKVLERGESVQEREMECDFTGEKPVPVSVSTSAIINDENRYIGQVLIIRDLGEVRRLQSEVSRHERLAAIGGLAAGVAHEIRNPLSSIKGIATYFRTRFEKEEDDAEMADVMITEVDRLNRVVTELLEFAKPTDLRTSRVDVRTLVTHSVRLVQGEADRQGTRVLVKVPEEPLEAGMDTDRFSQCLLNLYLNALQAMGSGGTLTITPGPAAGDMVEIPVRDTGPGIGTEHLNLVFDPYFTTKAKGTGLGLAIVHKIVEAHGGTVKIRSAPGRGAAFSIRVPRHAPSGETHEADKAP